MRKIVIYIILIFITAGLNAQIKTHLPYSIFGIGELTGKAQIRNMGMGKTGIAL